MLGFVVCCLLSSLSVFGVVRVVCCVLCVVVSCLLSRSSLFVVVCRGLLLVSFVVVWLFVVGCCV